VGQKRISQALQPATTPLHCAVHQEVPSGCPSPSYCENGTLSNRTQVVPVEVSVVVVSEPVVTLPVVAVVVTLVLLVCEPVVAVNV
jgi:hypothetical protein